MVEERPPLFDRWCGTGERLPAHTVAHGKHSPRGVAPSTVIPAGRLPGVEKGLWRLSVSPCSFVT